MKSLKMILQYLKPYRLFVFLAPFLMFIEVAMDLLQPMIMQHMIDDGIANSDNAYVIKLGLLMIVTAIVGLIAGMGCTVYSTKSAVNFAADLRKDVFNKTTHFSSENTDSFSTGKLITIVTNDITIIQQTLMMTLRILVRGPLLFIGSVVIIWFTIPELFPILIIVIPILIFFIYIFFNYAGKLFIKVQKALDKVNTKLQETFSGIRIIKAFHRQKHEQNQIEHLNTQLTKRNLDAEKIMLTLMPIMMFIVNLGIVVGMWIGAIKVNEGSFQVGQILAFINYLNIILQGLMSSSHVIMMIARSFTSADRINQVLTTEYTIHDSGDVAYHSDRKIKGHLEFRNVDFSYSKNGENVLNDISFQARAGETIGVIGSTGSGKSTLVKLIPRLYDPDHGDIYIDGRNIRQMSLKQLRGIVGIVPQKATLFSGSIAENLRFGKKDASILEMEAAAQVAAATEFINKFDDSFDHELTQGATNLSGGQKQRLTMARAFISQPRVLVLDDSTSAIDAISEAFVQDALKKEYPDTTLIIISSKISSIIDADQILVVDDGSIAAIGKHEDLIRTSHLYREIYETQNGKGGLSYE